MRTALRTAIATALVAGAAITTPAFAAGAAFAADGPVAAPSASAGAGAPSTGTEGTDGAEKEAPKPEAPKDEAPKDEAPKDEAPKDEAPKDEAPKDEAPKTDAPKTDAPKTGDEKEQGDGTFVRDVKMSNGAVAKIFKVGEQHHRADFYKQGQIVGALSADGRPAASNDDGTFLVLTPSGETTTWSGGYTRRAAPGVYELVNGTRLELAKKDGRYGIQLVENGVGRGFTYPADYRAVLYFGSATVILERDGGLAAHLPGAGAQTPPKLVTDTTAPAPDSGVVIVHGKCTVSKIVSIGAGTKAELFMSQQGPVAEFSDAGDDKVFAFVDRAHPSLPASVGFVGRIIDPNSATPSLYTKVEGGGAKGATNAFPKLPKGCKLEAAPGDSSSNGSSDTTPQTGQTTVVPKGGVAAGAEFGAEDGTTALMMTGAGAASLAAAGLGFVVLRRRAAARV
ncbi:hypothetical protein ACFUT3_20130 [Streptomyces cinereoruber]|uniref:hypothetical protein n=1 Tax=Streptomyces cinereoruber TaxID=67260 RepID=UPI00362637E1